MTYWLVVLIAAILMFYSLLSWKFGDLFEIAKTLKKIRRCWYSFCLLAYTIYINTDNYKVSTGYNQLLVSQEVWNLLVLFIVFMSLGVVVDALVLRTTSLGEFKFGGFGGKFLGDEAKENIKEQIKNIELIYDKIEAEHEVIQILDSYLASIRDRLLAGEELDWLAEFEELLKKYCQAQNSNVDVAIYNTTDETMAQIKEHFKLTGSKYKDLKRNLAIVKSTFCDKNSDTLNYEKDVLFVPVVSEYYEGNLLISLQGKSNILDNEQFFILNLIKLFEVNVFNILKQIDLEEQIQQTEQAQQTEQVQQTNN